MMTDNDLENLYKTALPVSHYAGLRAVFDAGYGVGAGAVEYTDVSLNASAATVTTDDQAPIVTP
jgi:hypothetical protein